MRVARTVAEMRAEVTGARRASADAVIGLVPTMGALHDGHRSLIAAARDHCDVVVVSIFVNPAQFEEQGDLIAYPGDEAHDLEIAAAKGADVAFCPCASEVYPPRFDTTVAVGGVTDVLCGDPARRGRSHFDGVTTVVTKLFNIVAPDIAYFGQKDAQQAVVIRKLVADLDMAVRIEVRQTVREPDGLAMSSRNAHLTTEERDRATALSRALRAADAKVSAGRRDAEAVLAAARSELDSAGVEPEYLELRSANDLASVDRVNGSTLLAVAARFGRTRLIDNAILGDR